MKALVSFGQYLLSKERRKLFASHPVFGKKNLNERLSQVWDADISNWKNSYEK